MKLIFYILLLLLLSSCGSNNNENNENNNEPLIPPLDVVFVEGGYIISPTMTNLYGTPIIMQDFYIGRFQVTQQEWYEVMGENPSGFVNDNNPVETVSWYDVILFLNRRSELAGLEPFYNIDKENADQNNLSESDNIRWAVTINDDANGYRLPTTIEWEYAAGGGQISRSYIFSGSDDPTQVSWHFRNSGDIFLDGMWHWPTLEANNGRPRNVGQKPPNELGLYDMSGNVREWIWNWHHEEQLTPASGEWRGVRGGSWVAGEDAGRVGFRDGMPPYFRTYELGFRVARNS